MKIKSFVLIPPLTLFMSLFPMLKAWSPDVPLITAPKAPAHYAPAWLKSATAYTPSVVVKKKVLVAKGLPKVLHGIYLTAYTAGSPTRLRALIRLAHAEHINAFVIDIKNDQGYVAFPSHNAYAQKIHAVYPLISSLPRLVKLLKANGITPIARIVAFKDSIAAVANSAGAIHLQNGALYRDGMGQAWMSIADKKNWPYVIAIAKEAIQAGFPEIQFDYTRFPARPTGLVIPGLGKQKRASVVLSFFRYAKKELAPTPIAQDLFGLTTIATNSMSVGESIVSIAKTVNSISPMVYPALYAPYTFGYPDPAQHPFSLVYKSLFSAKTRLHGLQTSVVPWIQDFSLKDPYGPYQIGQQVRAVYAAGYRSWFIWNPANTYTKATFSQIPPMPNPS